MPVYEKADYIAAYSYCPVDASNNRRFAGYRGPEVSGLVDYNPVTGIYFRLHYHPNYGRPEALRRAQKLIDFQASIGAPLSASSALVIVGGAYGWLGEALISLIPGIVAVSVDLSQYVQDTKDLSPDDELIESIQAAGYDHTIPNSVGKYLFDLFTDPAPRATIEIAQEDLSNTGSRNRVRNKLPRNATLIVTEEVWQVMSATEKDYVTQASTTWNIPVTHIIDGIYTQ